MKPLPPLPLGRHIGRQKNGGVIGRPMAREQGLRQSAILRKDDVTAMKIAQPKVIQLRAKEHGDYSA